MRLVVLADDYTGAVDTGIQFAKLGIAAGYYQDMDRFEKALTSGEQEVYVMNTMSRHLTGQEAHEKVRTCAEAAAAGGVAHIIKKTDSGLRGNIGSELSGLLRGTGQDELVFIPAYPKMNRVTRQGIHWIDGIPVRESVFGRDPFEPVVSSLVAELASWGNMPVCSRALKRSSMEPECTGEEEVREADFEGIQVWDAETEEDIRTIAGRRLETGRKQAYPCLWAGCAGLAEILAEMLPFTYNRKEEVTLPERFLTVCGSVNAVTQAQVMYAQASGFIRVVLSEAGQLTEGYAASKEGRDLTDAVLKSCMPGQAVIVDTGFPSSEQIREQAARAGYSETEAGSRSAVALGELLCMVSGQKNPPVLMIIGGDTLQAYMDRKGFEEIELRRELMPGVVLLRGIRQQETQWIITKSGAFGSEELLTELEAWLRQL